MILRPRLHLGLELYFNAFNDLTHSRSVGMSLGSIPWEVKQMYAVDYLSLIGDEIFTFHSLLSHMDGVYLKHMSGKRDKNDGDK